LHIEIEGTSEAIGNFIKNEKIVVEKQETKKNPS